MSDLHYFKPDWILKSTERLTVDLCIYGASSAGITAACEAMKRGKSCVLLQPGKFIGGLTTGGLGWTDHGRKNVIGGMSRDFYRRVGKIYGKDEEFHFEPHAATAVYEEMLKEQNVDLRLCQYFEKATVAAGKITEIALMGGLRVAAKMFIDATYEGDLMAGAGVSYFVGREPNSKYNETLSGIQVLEKHQFGNPVDPYVTEGDPKSGLLPGIIAEDLSTKIGQGDLRVQAYNFRICMTDDPALKIDWEKPKDFDPMQYVLAGRWFRGPKDAYNEQLRNPDPMVISKFDVFSNKTKGGFSKTDTNNHGPVSSDFIGANYEWPEACCETREKIFQAHVTYQRGFYWYMANSPDVPERYRKAYARWGLPKDEFTATENWPHQLYVREARRLVSDHVITEADCRGTAVSQDSVAMGSYAMDSHNCSRFVKIENGKARVLNDGDVQIPAAAYPISYRSIVPKRTEVKNLFVAVCLSSSHIAYGSARMEPVFMALGQSAAIAASLAIDANVAVQDVKYADLQKELLAIGQVLTLAKSEG